MLYKYIVTWLCIISLLLITGCSDTPSNALKLAEKGVTASAISHNAKYVAVASANHDTAIWDLNSKQYLYSLRHRKNKKANIIAMKFSQDDKYLLTSERKHLVLWHVKSGKAINHFDLPFEIQAIDINQDGSRALIGLISGESYLMDLKTGFIYSAFKQTETVNTVALSHSQQIMATGGDDQSIIVWQQGKNEPNYIMPLQKNIMQLGFSPDDKLLFSACTYDYVRLFDQESGKLIHKLPTPKLSVTSFTFSNDGQYLALGVMPQTLQLWQLTPKPIKIKQWHLPTASFWRPAASLIYSIAFDPKNNQLITSDSRGYALFWQFGYRH